MRSLAAESTATVAQAFSLLLPWSFLRTEEGMLVAAFIAGLSLWFFFDLFKLIRLLLNRLLIQAELYLSRGLRVHSQASAELQQLSQLLQSRRGISPARLRHQS